MGFFYPQGYVVPNQEYCPFCMGEKITVELNCFDIPHNGLTRTMYMDDHTYYAKYWYIVNDQARNGTPEGAD